jgi:hypothetical protein
VSNHLELLGAYFTANEQSAMHISANNSDHKDSQILGVKNKTLTVIGDLVVQLSLSTGE